MYCRIVTWTLLASLAWSAQAISAESASDLLEKAIFTEETVGDLDSAMKMYGQILAKEQADRAVAAQALYRLGSCRLRKGDKAGATQAFKRLLSDFPGETNIGQRAKRELDKLSGVSSAVPLVVETNPQNFANNVSPSLKAITVTFDRPMADESWAWTFTDKKMFPKTKGHPKYDDSLTTCSLPVELEPGHVYWLGINSGDCRSFQTAQGVSAKDHVILFATQGADGKATLIPDHLLAKAKEIISQPAASGATAGPSTHGLKLQPAPWADGERMQLSIKTPTGAELGTMIYTADAIKVQAKEAWSVRCSMIISATAQEQYTQVEAEKESFAPITGRTTNWMGDHRATYTQGKAHLKSTANGKETVKDVALKGTAYDNEQALYLLRRLPLEKGHSVRFNIFAVQGGVVVQCRIEITDIEKVTVAAGTYECFKMKLGIYYGQQKTLEHTLWFSTDEHRYLVKYDAESAVMELTRVGTRSNAKPATFEDNESGISLTAPAGWDFYKASPQRGQQVTINLLAPELAYWCTLAVGEPVPSGSTIRRIAEEDTQRLKGYFKNYTVRLNSWAELKIGGMPAAQYIADYTDKDQAKIEYRTYASGRAAIYWFVFRVDKDSFETVKPTLDALMASLKVK